MLGNMIKTHKFQIDYHRSFSHNGTLGQDISTPTTTADHKERNITIFNYYERSKDQDPQLGLGSGVFSLSLVMKAKGRFPVNDRLPIANRRL